MISSSCSLQCIIGKSEDKPYNLDHDNSCHELVDNLHYSACLIKDGSKKEFVLFIYCSYQFAVGI